MAVIHMDNEKLLTWPPMVLLLVVVCSLLWGSAFPVVKTGFNLLEIGGNTAGMLYFAGYRFLIAGMMLFIGLWLMRRPVRLAGRREYTIVLVVALLQTTLQYYFFYIGLSNTTGVKAAVIVGSGSFFLAFFSHWWIAGDRLNTRKVIGLVMGFMGIVIINFRRELMSFEFRLDGEGFILLTNLTSAIAMILVKRYAGRVSPPLLSAYQLTFGAVALLAIAAATAPPSVVQFDGKTFGLLIYLSFLSAAAFSLWYMLILYNQLTRMAVYRFLIPVCGTLLSALFLPAEQLTQVALVALVLVSTGMILTSRG